MSAERSQSFRVQAGIGGAPAGARPAAGSTADGTTRISGPEMREQDSVGGPRSSDGYRDAVAEEMLQAPEAV